ncbi:MAG: Helix-hairpin-helix motif [Vampirovibrio sp.]|jgi:DNA uptake protein ComE-like DNA-binding protein|nr:Helix-hairpin-helix motif [Vampirovibrio sp.]
MRQAKPKLLNIACLLAVCLLGIAPLTLSSASANEYWETYMPPELAFADDLNQKVTVPERVNINRGSLNQLLVLPGFNEEIALKVIRHRPFEGVQDFYKKMPGLEKKNIDRLIQQIQPKVLFK